MPIEISTHLGRQISAIRTGDGPVVVLLPPGASSAAAWRGVTAELSATFECLAVNLSGYAETETFHSNRAMTLDDEAKAVLALLGSRKAEVHLVGHSYGGAVAINLVQHHGHRFSSLTLIEPAAYPMLMQVGELELAEDVLQINRAFITRVHNGDNDAAFRGYFDFYNNGPRKWTDLSGSAKQRLLAVAKPVAAALEAVHASDSKLDELANLQIPTLVVAGAETDKVHARLARAIAHKIANSRLEIIPQAGHMCSLTHPVELAGLILSHIADV
ncbi:MAG: alpha/beta fold hydrolase [Rhizobiaceae bacterium]